MVDSKTLATSLSVFAGIGTKKASALTPPTDQPTSDAKLQAIIGDPGEQKSTFAQTNPAIGNQLLANPLAPFEGDEIFFSNLVPGARFQAHDGSWWDINDYDWEGRVTISNTWYPNRLQGVVSVQDVRRSIYSWIEPVLQVVPPIPIGVDYGVVETRAV